VAAGIWVATLFISARTAEKLAQKHDLSPQEVRDAVVCVERLPFAWDDDPDRGRRAIVDTTIRERRVLVVLYPAADPFGDAWHLGSAYFM
jgi:hypothetical protein